MPRQAKTGSGECDREAKRKRRLYAREYAGKILERALEENEYRSSTMRWPPEEHPLVMAELKKISDSLYVVPGAFG